MSALIQPFSQEQLPRVVELLQRANQYHFTAQRLTSLEINQYLAHQSGALITLTLKDRCGEYGLVALALLQYLEKQIRVDHLVLSCRAANRGVEFALLEYLGQLAVNKSLPELAICYKPSGRNQLCLEILQHCHFQPIANNLWVIPAHTKWPSHCIGPWK